MMRTTSTSTVLGGLLTLVLLLIVAPASAQESTTRGWVLGLHVGGASIEPEGADRTNGGGGGLFVGYGLNRKFTLFARLDGANIEVEDDVDTQGTWVMGHVDLGARFNFANSLRSVVPYVEGAFTGRVVEVSELPATNPFGGQEISFSGGALTLGGGVMVYASETVAIDLGLLFSGGEFTDVTVGNTTVSGFDLDTRSTRFNIGVAWWL